MFAPFNQSSLLLRFELENVTHSQEEKTKAANRAPYTIGCLLIA
ncbi:hypothetical protein [Geobacillus thermodenitrificans]|jgi:hypothetical protein|uniref:Uncharacterized protein n=1 Tax=Geobacillus thermodenitrificans TaxID=33940 RepID=A0ABY9QGI5_GEOTD|nr:hypothetical protein [Geobacillus thermodenitrificans]WMV77565.1 hypothetical protein HSX42_07405 [Geobacillus thermodenitrificans]